MATVRPTGIDYCAADCAGAGHPPAKSIALPQQSSRVRSSAPCRRSYTGMAREGDATPSRGRNEERSRCCCRAFPTSVARSSVATAGPSLLAAVLCRLRSRLSGRARLRNSMPWPTPTPGPMKSRRSTSTCSRPGSLADADVPRAREMFRKRLDRAGFKGAIVVGGIEVAWQENWQRWLLHAQVLAIGVDANAWKQLEAALEDSGTAKPVRPRPAVRPRRAALLLHQVRYLSSTRTPPRPLASGSPRRTRGVVVATSLRGLLVRLWRPSSRRSHLSSTSSSPGRVGPPTPERHRQTTHDWLRNIGEARQC